MSFLSFFASPKDGLPVTIDDSDDEYDDQEEQMLTNDLTPGKGIFPYTRDCKSCGMIGGYLRKGGCTNRNCILARRCMICLRVILSIS